MTNSTAIAPSEMVLMESKSARDAQMSEFSQEKAAQALEKVKGLVFALHQGMAIASTEQVAEFYEVTEEVVRDNVRRHKSEFESDGLRVLKGKALKDASEIISLANKTTQVTIWNARATFRLGFLLRDSAIAKQIRTSALDIVERAIAKPAPRSPSLEISPSFITEAIDAVLKGTDIHPSLIAGVKANRIADRFPALKGDMEAVKRLLPVAVDEQLVTPTTLTDIYCERSGIRCSAQQINVMLRDAGLQFKGVSKDNPWLPTESGKAHSQMVLQTASGRDKTVYQLRWKPSVLNALRIAPST